LAPATGGASLLVGVASAGLATAGNVAFAKAADRMDGNANNGKRQINLK